MEKNLKERRNQENEEKKSKPWDGIHVGDVLRHKYSSVSLCIIKEPEECEYAKTCVRFERTEGDECRCAAAVVIDTTDNGSPYHDTTLEPFTVFTCCLMSTTRETESPYERPYIKWKAGRAVRLGSKARACVPLGYPSTGKNQGR